MQLYVACNLIPNGVRMISWGWIISHRCSWMAVYVFWRKARINLIVILVHSLFVNWPAVICSPSMLFIYFGETPLVNCGPRSFLNHDNTNNYNSLFFPFTASKHHSPHYASNALFSARPVRLITSLFRWGKIECLICVQVPRSLLTLVVRLANVRHLHLKKWFFPSYWVD